MSYVRNIERVMAAAAVVMLLAVAGPLPAQGSGELFPQPFLVEHQLVQTDPDGAVFAADPVVDHYAGALVVSVRPDGSRSVIDLAARTITEIRPDRGTYTVLSFDQLADLRLRLWQAEMQQVDPARLLAQAEKRAHKPAEPAFSLERLPVEQGVDGPVAARQTVQRSGVEHLRVRLAPESSSSKTETQRDALAVDVWLDPSIRMSEAGREALAAFETEVLAGVEEDGEVPPARYITEACRQAQGAIPVRTRRPASAAAALAGDAPILEDVVLRLQPLEELQPELITVPEGYRRTVHPLQQMVAYAEEQAEVIQRADQATAANDG